jgi:hypothetical protein
MSDLKFVNDNVVMELTIGDLSPAQTMKRLRSIEQNIRYLLGSCVDKGRFAIEGNRMVLQFDDDDLEEMNALIALLDQVRLRVEAFGALFQPRYRRAV